MTTPEDRAYTHIEDFIEHITEEEIDPLTILHIVTLLVKHAIGSYHPNHRASLIDQLYRHLRNDLT